jgi:hypothetical protein
MNLLKFLVLILLLCTPLSLFSADSKTKVLKPTNVKSKITTIISGKKRIYYPLSFKDASIISVKGPGKLKIITRVQFLNTKNQTLDYKVYYRIDGTEKIEEDFKDVKRSEHANYKIDSIGMPGTGENFLIELASGEHTIELWSGANNPKVTTRYLFTQTKEKKHEWTLLCPLFPNEPVDLVARETVVHYFRFSKDKPLRIKVFGPTLLRVLNRLENHYKMKGRINYRLQVKEDGTIKHTYLLNSIRSEITTYKNDVTKIPGKAKEIIINVPDGKHIYEIVPLDKDKDNVLCRILLPKKDVKLEE